MKHDVNFYLGLVDVWFRERDRVAKPSWDTARELYNCELFSGYQQQALRYEVDTVQPPRVLGLVQTSESIIFNRTPKFYCQPATVRQEKLARFCEIALNTEWRRDWNLIMESRLCLRDCLLTGIGIMLSGVACDYEYMRRRRAKRQREVEKRQQDPLFGTVDANIRAQSALGPDSVSFPESTTSSEMDDLIWNGRIFSKRVAPEDFICDVVATCIGDASVVGRRIYMRLDALKADDTIDHGRQVQATHTLNQKTGRYQAVNSIGQRGHQVESPGDTTAGYDYAEVYELFIRQPDGKWDMALLSRDVDDFLRYEEDVYMLGCPYKVLRWNHLGNRMLCVSDVQPIMTQVIEEREIRTRLHDAYMRGAVDVYAVDSQAMHSEEDMQSVTMPGIGEFIKLNMNGRNAQQVITLLQRNPQTQEALAYLAIIQKDIETGTGLGANQMLNPLKSETSATEAATIQQYASARGQIKYEAFNEFISSVALDRLKLAAQYYTDEDMAGVAGPEAAVLWAMEMFERGDIQFGLNVFVEQGSMQPRNDQTRLQAVQFALQAANTNPVPAQLLNVIELWKEFFRLLGFESGSKFLNDGVDASMMQEMSAMMGTMGVGAGGGSEAAPPAQASGEAGMRQMSGSAA